MWSNAGKKLQQILTDIILHQPRTLTINPPLAAALESLLSLSGASKKSNWVAVKSFQMFISRRPLLCCFCFGRHHFRFGQEQVCRLQTPPPEPDVSTKTNNNRRSSGRFVNLLKTLPGCCACFWQTTVQNDNNNNSSMWQSKYTFFAADAAKTISLTSRIPAGSLVNFLHYWWDNEEQEKGESSLSQLTLIPSNTESFSCSSKRFGFNSEAEIQQLALKFLLKFLAAKNKNGTEIYVYTSR